MKKKGFTLVELLVVVAIIALLVAILAPALSRVKQHAERVVCGTNLKGLGNSFAVYAASFGGDYPVQGDSPPADDPHEWDWRTTGFQAGSAKNWAQSGSITVGASLYLLIRETDVTPKQFVCPSGDQKPYKGENAGGVGGEALDIVELWDFGMYMGTSIGAGRGPQHGPCNHVSYSYQLPYDVTSGAFPAYPPDSSADASMAIMADKNPWYDPELMYIELSNLKSNPDASETYVSFVSMIDFQDTIDGEPNPDWERWMVEVGNAQPHLRQGQEILWGDGHATFGRRPDVGVKNDNIYAPYGGTDSPPWTVRHIRRGGFYPPPPRLGSAANRPKCGIDSFLVNDDHIRFGDG